MTFALIAFLLILYFFLSTMRINNPRKIFVILSTLVMILISGLRNEAVGNDTYATILQYERAMATNWNEILANFWERYLDPNSYIGKDPAEDVFYKILSYFTTDSRIFLFITATIILCMLGTFIYKNTTSLRSVFFSYVFYVSLIYQFIPNSAFRQSMAFALLLPAITTLSKKKYLSFIFFIFWASLFHKSALIAIILLPLFFINNVKIIYWFSIIPFLYVFVYYQAVGLILSETSDIYENYLSVNYYRFNNQPFMVIIMVLGLYLYNGFSLNFDKKYNDNKLLYYGTALTLIFIPLIRLDPSALRLIAYFGILLAIQVGNSSYISDTMRSLFWVIVFIFLFKAAIKPDDGYRFMWQQKQLHERYGMIYAPRQEQTKIRTNVLEINYIEQKGKHTA